LPACGSDRAHDALVGIDIVDQDGNRLDPSRGCGPRLQNAQTPIDVSVSGGFCMIENTTEYAGLYS
jgi:hypothetical protein